MSERDRACIQRTFFGGRESVTFEQFAVEVITVESEAVDIALSMLGGAVPYPFNDRHTGAEPDAYEEFDVLDRRELERQVGLSASAMGPRR